MHTSLFKDYIFLLTVIQTVLGQHFLNFIIDLVRTIPISITFAKTLKIWVDLLQVQQEKSNGEGTMHFSDIYELHIIAVLIKLKLSFSGYFALQRHSLQLYFVVQVWSG